MDLPLKNAVFSYARARTYAYVRETAFRVVFFMTNNQDTKLLISKTEDAAEFALKTGSPRFTSFLSDAQRYFVKTQAHYRRDDVVLEFFGGYDDADYSCAGFFPAYLFYDDTFCAKDAFPIKAVLAKGSGFRKLTHRDFLGSLMSLGIKREVIGDIVVSDDGFSAYIFCLEKTADYLVTAFDCAANDKITCSVCDIHDIAVPSRKTQELNITVNSPRIDAVIGAVLKLSRDDAEKLISSGAVSLNHTVCTEKSKLCDEGFVVSVRHHGRFIIQQFGDRNRRDRLRITVAKFI